jgi:hypothetical protein
MVRKKFAGPGKDGEKQHEPFAPGGSSCLADAFFLVHPRTLDIL